ncbi:TraR/DksA C4-type zinc finger protein [Pseudomonas aeruginosa]|nr:TraR/DksA C4-type zinc finger protein [Pseudomonas aeruginosa]MBW6123270.1 TraR/DksA C4-type zinc finger protein [Pseudomonas aeruginosa]
MADWVDRALEREELELERALAAQLASAKPSGPSLPYCATCGDEIPAKRQALGGVTRCFPCQTTFEKGTRR